MSDFPDEKLWDHPNTLLIPHLGASTEEAEEAAAAMAANTIRTFLETGTVTNTVNFPEVKLPTLPSDDTVARVCIVNKNLPGTLAAITQLFGDAKINVIQQVNASRGDVAYNVIDLAKPDESAELTYASWEELQAALTSVENVISTRFILNKGDGSSVGNYYAKQIEGVYYH